MMQWFLPNTKIPMTAILSCTLTLTATFDLDAPTPQVLGSPNTICLELFNTRCRHTFENNNTNDSNMFNFFLGKFESSSFLKGHVTTFIQPKRLAIAKNEENKQPEQFSFTFTATFDLCTPKNRFLHNSKCQKSGITYT